jgi:hypothetical protein
MAYEINLNRHLCFQSVTNKKRNTFNEIKKKTNVLFVYLKDEKKTICFNRSQGGGQVKTCDYLSLINDIPIFC